MKKRVAAARRGYTVIELLTAVSIAATLAALVIPAFDAVVKDNRRASAANELLRVLRYARLEAAKRGQRVIACGVADADHDGSIGPAERACIGRNWSDGWMTAVWRDADGDATVDPVELEVLDVRINGARGAVTVQANGLAAMPPVAPRGTAVLEPFLHRCSNGTITICDARGSAQARAVILSPNGRARVSSRKADGSPLACP